MVARRLSVLVLGLACLGLAVQSTLGQGAGTTETLRFRNPKKDYAEDRANGVITEAGGMVKVVANNKTLAEVPASRVIAVDYTALPGLEKTLTDLRAAENQGAALKARDLYTAELKKNPADPKTKRFLDYREAYWSLKVVESKTGDALKAEAPAVIAKLKGFTQEYSKKNAWEVWPISRGTARLQAELGNLGDAASTYSFLAKIDKLAPNMQLEARISEMQMLLASGNMLTAVPVMDEVAKMPATGPHQEKVKILSLAIKAIAEKKSKAKPEAAIKAIEAIITKAADPSVRSMGHNVLGELYLQHDLPRDAMWEFLRVEVVENSDKDEVIFAIWRLAGVFQKLGDEARANLYREKLPQVKGT